MNEAILKWLASSTIGLVVCSSLWLAGSVQHEFNAGVPMLSQAPKTDKKTAAELRLAVRAIKATASELAVKAAVSVN